MPAEEVEGEILGLESVIDMLRGESIMLMFLSRHQRMTTDEEKADLLCKCMKDASDLTDILLKGASEEIYRQHNNYSTRMTDSPEDMASCRDKIVLKAIEMYLEKAQK